MFTNLHIQATLGAPEEFLETGSTYFAHNEQLKLHEFTSKLSQTFAPAQGLETVVLLDSSESVEEEFQQVGVDGKYLRRYFCATIHILHNNLNGYARAVFWHEYGHHIWESMNASYLAEWKDIERLMPSNISYQKAQELDEFAEEQYLTLPKELWARLFCQYLLVQLNDTEAWEKLSLFPEIFWSASDIRQFSPLIERLLITLRFHAKIPL
jgi:hypothetical protein